MSDKPPDKMSAEEINRAIAEELGWTDIHPGKLYAFEIYGNSPDKTIARTRLPNFMGDLNACAEMECSGIPVEKATTYDRELGNICARDFSSNRQRGIGYNLWHATAPQRCEAFLRTVGKWRGA